MTVPTLRVSRLTDLLALVPSLLGFTPTDSIVVCGIDGTRLVVTARLDIVEPDAEAARMLAGVAHSLTRVGADHAVVIAYHTGPRSNAIPLVEGIGATFPLLGIDVQRPIYVTGDPRSGEAVFCCLCGDPKCATGTVPPPREMPGLGHRGPITRTRAEVAASIEAGPRAEAVGRALTRLGELSGRLGKLSPQQAARAVQDLLARPIDQMSDADVAAAAHAIRSSHREQLAFGTNEPDSGDPFDRAAARFATDAVRVDRLAGLAACLPDDMAGECLELLAATAYSTGDGAFAHMALDRAERHAALGSLGTTVRALCEIGEPPRG